MEALSLNSNGPGFYSVKIKAKIKGLTPGTMIATSSLVTYFLSEHQ